MSQPISIPKRFPPPPPKTSPLRTGGRSRSTSPPPLDHMVPRRPSLLEETLFSGTTVLAATQPQHLEDEDEPIIIFHSKNSAVFASPIQPSRDAATPADMRSQHAPHVSHDSSHDTERRSHVSHVVPPQHRPMPTMPHHQPQQRTHQLRPEEHHPFNTLPQRQVELQPPKIEQQASTASQAELVKAPLLQKSSGSARAVSTTLSAVGPIGGPRGQARLPLNPERSPLPTLQPSTLSASSSVAFGGSSAATEAPSHSSTKQKGGLTASIAAMCGAPATASGRRAPIPSHQLSTNASGDASPLSQEQHHATHSTRHDNNGPSPINQLLPAPKGLPYAAQDEQRFVVPAAKEESSAPAAATPASPQNHISIVLKGSWAAPTTATIPPSRIIEVSLPLSATVSDAIQQCLSVLDTDKALHNAQLQVVSGELEQGNQILPQHAVLESTSRVSELYFLLVRYAAIVAVSQRHVSPTSMTDKHSLSLLEARLSTLEHFVRAKSSPRRDDLESLAAPGSSSQAAPVVHHGNSYSPLKALPDDFSIPGLSPIQAAGGPSVDEMTQLLLAHQAADTHSALLLSQYRNGGVVSQQPKQQLTELNESYTSRAEKLAFLALASRTERLAKLNDIKQSISQKVEMYQWMSQRSNPALDQQQQQHQHQQHLHANPTPQQTTSLERLFPAADARVRHVNPHLPSDAAVSREFFRAQSGDAALSGKRNHWAPPEPEIVDHENVHVDYDPVLDIWKLRKGPPI
jgi:hypothetical protein